MHSGLNNLAVPSTNGCAGWMAFAGRMVEPSSERTAQKQRPGWVRQLPVDQARSESLNEIILNICRTAICDRTIYTQYILADKEPVHFSQIFCREREKVSPSKRQCRKKLRFQKVIRQIFEILKFKVRLVMVNIGDCQLILVAAKLFSENWNR